MKKVYDDYSLKKKKRKENKLWTLTGGHLCKASPKPRGPVPKAGTLKDFDDGSGVHL